MRRFLFLLFFLLRAVFSKAQQDETELYHRFFQNGQCDRTAFEEAWRGYNILLSEGVLQNSRYLSIIDFSKPSNVKRFFVLDVKEQRLALSSITAHGLGSDPDSITVPCRFSNCNNSRMSSVGFYITGRTYGNHRPDDSTGLCLFGLDKGYNDSAAIREIVIHYGATEYKGNVYVTDTGAARSFGCPALPLSTNSRIINMIRNGSCLFIYSDKARLYAQSSTVLNRRLKFPIRQQGPPPNNCSCNLKQH